MTRDESARKPIDEAALEAWLAEVFEVPAAPQWSPGSAPAMRSLVSNVRATLVPIEPSPSFVRELGLALAQQASRQQQSLKQRYRRAVWFGLAAAGSVASIVGVVAYVFYHRERPPARSLSN